MEELIKEKKDNRTRIDDLTERNSQIKEKISSKEKILDTAIIKRDLAKRGERIQKEKLEKIRKPKEQKKEAIHTGAALAATTAFVGTVTLGNINTRFIAPVAIASGVVGIGTGIIKLAAYSMFQKRNSEAEIIFDCDRCRMNAEHALNEILGITDEIKELADQVKENESEIARLTARNAQLSIEIGKEKKSEQPGRVYTKTSKAN